MPGTYRPLKHRERLGAHEHAVLAVLERQPLAVWPRAALVEAAGVSDRTMRKAVEVLRKAGWPVLSSSQGGGYWLARTADEVAEFRSRELHSRARVIHEADQVLAEVEQLMREREARQAALF